MGLTRDFKETVKARAERDARFREALLTESVELLITGEVEVGKAVLRDYINATVGFEKLSKVTGTPSKSLMRMFGPKGIRARTICLPSLASSSACPAFASLLRLATESGLPSEEVA